MRITCTYCGSRDSSEFAYHGDASVVRPGPDCDARMFDYIYLRDNPAGPHDELWYHVQGCRRWLRVTRDTRTHEILAVVAASSR